MVAKIFSAYDERPDPKGPGKQGVLFRNQAPAQDQETRNHNAPMADDWPKGATRVQDHQKGTVQGALFGADKTSFPTVTVRGAKGLSEGYRGGVQPETERADPRLAKGRATGMVPQELYHGTSARLKPGSLIKPGKPGNFDSSEHGQTLDTGHEHVFATENLHDAYRFSRIAQEKKTNEGSPARAHVYRVQPTSSVQTDAEDEDTRAGNNNYGADLGGGNFGPTSSMGAFQSKKPLRVMNEVQFSEAKEAHRSYNEDELGAEPGDYDFAARVPGGDDGW